MNPRLSLVLVRHGYRLWRAGQLRFRMETFGLYYPAEPYSQHWTHMRPASLRLLLARLPAYARWVAEMEDLQRRDRRQGRRTRWIWRNKR